MTCEARLTQSCVQNCSVVSKLYDSGPATAYCDNLTEAWSQIMPPAVRL